MILYGGYARGRLVRSTTTTQREEAEVMCHLAELGWGRQDPAFRQFFTTQFIPGGTAEQRIADLQDRLASLRGYL